MKTAAHIAISIALVFSSVVHNETRTQATSLPFAPFAPLAPATTEILPYASGTGYVGSEAPGSAGPAPINCNAPPYTTAITELDSQKNAWLGDALAAVPGRVVHFYDAGAKRHNGGRPAGSHSAGWVHDLRDTHQP